MANLLTDGQAQRVGRVVRAYETERPGGTHDVGQRGRESSLTVPWSNIGSTTVPAFGIILIAGQTQIPDPLRSGFQQQVVSGRYPNNLLGRFAVNTGVDVAAGEIGFCHLAGPAKALISSTSSNGCYGPTPNSHLLQPSISTGLPGFDQLWQLTDHQPGPYAWVIVRPILAAQVSVSVLITPGSTGSCTVGGYTIQGTNRTTANKTAGSNARVVRLFDEPSGNAWDIIF